MTKSPLTVVAALLLLCGCGGGPREQGSGEAEAGPIRFEEAAAETGLDFQHFIGSTGEYFMVEIMGSGVALFDYDGDGDLDVYLLQGRMVQPDRKPEEARFAPPEKHWPGNRLFRNEWIPSGEVRFTDVSGEAGVGDPGYGMGVAVGDFDNDGDPDLYVTNFGPNVFYRNNGDGTFTDITKQAGAQDERWSTSASFVDYDRDGDLDLFFTNYIDFTPTNNKECFDPTGARDYCTPAVYRPVPDRLFRNEGNGRFRDVSQSAGLGAAFGNGLGAITADFDGDGWIDIYVTNDGNANQLWRNQGDGTFEDIALLSGTAYNADGMAEAGMGVAAGDFDGDGDEDLFMTHLAQETNTLYVNNGRAEFRDVTDQMGLGSASMPYTGFGTAWFDLDHDGWLDLFIANGAVTIMENQRGSAYPFLQKNQIFRGLGGGEFAEATAQAGSALQLEEVSRGAAFGDVDLDGDVDVVVSNNNGPARLFLNQLSGKNHWLFVRLEGTENNQDGYGARLALLRPEQKPLWRRAQSDGSYLSAGDPAGHFAWSGSAAIDGVGVIWPNGKREVFRGLEAGSRVRITEGQGEPWPAR